MAQVFQELLALLGITLIAPTNFADFIPWFFSISAAVGLISVVFKGFFGICWSFTGKGGLHL